MPKVETSSVELMEVSTCQQYFLRNASESYVNTGWNRACHQLGEGGYIFLYKSAACKYIVACGLKV